MTDKSPCLTCKGKYQECPFGQGQEWYFYYELRYCPYQIMWILQNLEDFELDIYPPHPRYEEPDIAAGYANQAYFCKPRAIYADINSRLGRTGKDGIILIEQLKQEKILFKELRPQARNACLYIRGVYPKETDYPQWLATINYRG